MLARGVTIREAETTTAAGAQVAASVLVLDDVRKRWPGSPGAVLAAVDLVLRPGEAVVLTGRNGAGKTTLLRIAASLITPDGGTVRIGGRDPERERRACQRQLGFLAAGSSGLYGRLDAERHLHLWSRLALMPPPQRAPAVAAAIERFALGAFCGRRVDRLSMGQRQRLRLALAFLHGPRLVLLDEPRTSLDDDGAALLAEAVRGLVAGGGAALICAPAAEAAGVTADRVLELRDGALGPA
jgi:ABC-type multidrug transport system ATPase subunit